MNRCACGVVNNVDANPNANRKTNANANPNPTANANPNPTANAAGSWVPVANVAMLVGKSFLIDITEYSVKYIIIYLIFFPPSPLKKHMGQQLDFWLGFVLQRSAPQKIQVISTCFWPGLCGAVGHGHGHQLNFQF